MKVKELVKMLQDCEFQDAEILPVANLTKEIFLTEMLSSIL